MHFYKIRNKALAGLLASLAALMLLAAPASAAVERVIVGFQPGKSAEARSAISQGRGNVVVDLSRHNALAIEIPSQALKGLKNNPNVVYVEEDLRRYPMAEVTPYGIGSVQADQAAQPGYGGKTVCIIDSGYDLGHPDLPTAVTGTFNSGGRGRYKGTGDSLIDGDGHGTHVAGTIAAIGGNGEGVVGVNSEGVNLVIVKVFGNNGSWAYSSTLVAAHDVCVDNGADITNMSLGGGGASSTEQNAFDNSPMLNIAAAGNDGTTGFSYPASYSSVVSVAAIDSANAVADFSQKNSQVDIAAPGVAVLSTVPMGAGYEASVAAPGGAYEATGMDGSPNGVATGTLIDCGLGTTACAASGGAICLIQRGDISFADKVASCDAGGGSGAVIYNNTEALFSGTAGTGSPIPSVGVSGTDGTALMAALGSSVTLTLQPGDYAHYDGTSMATPHVAGVAALVWGQPTLLGCTKAEVRSALENTALDLGASGRDDSYGHGLIQAKAAIDSLESTCGGGGPSPNQPPSAGFASACTDLACNFTDNSSDSDGSISSWSWDFGDGGSSSSQNPSHTYAATGTYEVWLTVTDDDGASDTASQSVSVSGGGSSNQNPVASFTENCTDLDCSFTDTSTDADGSIIGWSWDFGDGNTSINQNPSHSYGNSGTYTVILTVTDNEGASDSTSSDVTVSGGGGGDPVFTVQTFNAGKNWYSIVSSDTPFSGSFDNGASCSNETSCQSAQQRKKDGAMVFTPDVGDPITIIW